jgi:peptidoglycan/xylan/chitin deacetylase (PgdA/CDA1 family)
MYWKVIPRWWQRIFSSYIWKSPTASTLLSFDDGPHPDSTELILKHLSDKKLKALFFVLGKNVAKYPEIMEKIISQGHEVGIHGYNHINPWISSFKTFQEDFLLAEQICNSFDISTSYYRPPYGRITPRQARYVRRKGYTIMLWDIMPGDFEANRTKEECLKTISDSLSENSIIVLHDKPSCIDKTAYIIQNLQLCNG